jgi:hypothetical protein
MSNAAIKPAEASRQSERDALAVAIAARAEIDKRLAENEATIRRLEEATYTAVDVVAAARLAIDEVQAASITKLGDPGAPAPAMTLREARQALEDAETKLADLRTARDKASAVPNEMRTSLELARLAVDEAVAAVVAGESSTRALVQAYMKHAAEADSLRRVLEFLSSKKALPSDLARWWAVEASSERAAAWGASWKSLTADANAPLPAERELPGSTG